MKIEELYIKTKLFLEYKIKETNIIGIYLYGSRLYNHYNDKSDWDFIVIVDDFIETYIQYESTNVDIHIMSKEYYKELLNNHEIMALECFYQKNPILKYETEFCLDKTKLRHSISQKSSNSWVKAKKKMILKDEDSYIGLKSLYHSFRIVDFGIQIAKNNEIDFNFISPINKEDRQNIENPTWEYWEKLKPLHNNKMSEFRELCPKV